MLIAPQPGVGCTSVSHSVLGLCRLEPSVWACCPNRCVFIRAPTLVRLENHFLEVVSTLTNNLRSGRVSQSGILF